MTDAASHANDHRASAHRAASRVRYFRRLCSYAWRYKTLLGITVSMGVLGFLVTFVYPWLVGSAIDRVITGAPGSTPQSRTRWLMLIIVIAAANAVLSLIAIYGRGHFSDQLGNRVIADLRQDLFEHLHRLSLHFYSKERTGSIISRLINDIQNASGIVSSGALLLALDLLQIIIGTILMMTVSVKVTLATLAVLPLYGLTFRVLNPRVKAASDRVQSQISKISGNVQERLSCIALIKTSGTEDTERERFRADNEEFYGRVIHQSRVGHSVNAITEGLVHTGTLLVLGICGYLAINGTPPLTAGDCVKLLGWLGILYGPVRNFAHINLLYQSSLASIERVFQVFDITPKITERRRPLNAPTRGDVRFENVKFRYADDSDESRIRLEEPTPGSVAAEGANSPDVIAAIAGEAANRDKWILNGLDFSVAPGERVALVGPSGSGKSTIVSLLPRLYDTNEGRVLIDGADVRDYRLRDLQKTIGIVQQTSLVFSGTIRDNLCYGCDGVDDQKMIDAATAANAHEFIHQLPDGYNTQLGERGVNLSGGQLQRLSIARALLKNPRILILDEATSALDADSEMLIQQALDRVMQGRTCFIIAHRLSTIRNADRILVISEGRIVESGIHSQLISQDGMYARLAQKQFGVAHSPIPDTMVVPAA